MSPSPFRALAQSLHAAAVAPEKWAYASGLVSPRRLNLPDFLGIGAQKAGTTWLHEMLCGHPELYLASPKEVHYFDRRFHRTLSYYARRFDPGAHLLKGEVTPDYATLPPATIRFVRRTMPNVRLIYLLRNPVARAWSQAQRDLLRARKRTLDEVEDAEFRAHFRSQAALAHGDYMGNLDRWLSEFPPDQLFVGFTDDIEARPRELLTAVFQFLGVSTEVDWSRIDYRAQVNHRGKVAMPERFRRELYELFARHLDAMERSFGARVAAWRSQIDSPYPTATVAAGSSMSGTLTLEPASPIGC